MTTRQQALLHQVQRRFAKGRHLVDSSRLEVTAEYGLRAGCAEHHPTTVAEQEFIAVLCNHRRNLLPAKLIQPTGKSLEQLVLPRGCHTEVDAVAGDAAGPRLQPL